MQFSFILSTKSEKNIGKDFYSYTVYKTTALLSIVTPMKIQVCASFCFYSFLSYWLIGHRNADNWTPSSRSCKIRKRDNINRTTRSAYVGMRKLSAESLQLSLTGTSNRPAALSRQLIPIPTVSVKRPRNR